MATEFMTAWAIPGLKYRKALDFKVLAAHKLPSCVQIVKNVVYGYFPAASPVYFSMHHDRDGGRVKGIPEEDVHARQLYCYLMKQIFAKLALSAIGQTIHSKYHHTTVIHSIRAVLNWLDTGEITASKIDALKIQIIQALKQLEDDY